MAKQHCVTHRFVEHVPSSLEDGVVYVSIEFGTVIHKCCCGCGDKVVTPLTPVDWTVAYDGQTISLYPSVGRWDARCQSHYWIQNDKVIWSDKWSKSKIATLKQSDVGLRDDYFGVDEGALPQERGSRNSNQGPEYTSDRDRLESDGINIPSDGGVKPSGFFARLRRWWQRCNGP